MIDHLEFGDNTEIEIPAETQIGSQKMRSKPLRQHVRGSYGVSTLEPVHNTAFLSKSYGPNLLVKQPNRLIYTDFWWLVRIWFLKIFRTVLHFYRVQCFLTSNFSWHHLLFYEHSLANKLLVRKYWYTLISSLLIKLLDQLVL